MGKVITGPAGKATLVDSLDDPKWAETVCTWIIDTPGYHPFWHQWVLIVLRLRDNIPGFPPPNRKFPGATHELIEAACNPEEPRVTPEAMFQRGFSMPLLQPINIAEQYEATDAEMSRVAELISSAIVNGHMWPEPPLGYEQFRESWLVSVTKTLAHIRGEEHAP